MTWVAGTAAVVVALGGCSVSVSTDEEAKVPQAELEKGIADALEKTVGQRPDSVECPGDLAAKEGESVRCELTAGADRYGLTATISSIADGRANYDVQVDEEPVK